MNVERSIVIERPPAVVFDFYAVKHIRNHPRWDPGMELWPATDGPMGVGTVIRRRNTRGSTPVEGTMEVVEFVPEHAIGMIIRDGPFEITGRTTFEAVGEAATRLTTSVELPAGIDRFDPSFMERSLCNMKELIEAES